MNVGELKAALEEFPDDLDILTAKDDEGNGYRHLNYPPSVYYVNRNEADDYIIESVHGEDELTDDEDNDDWDLVYRADVVPRLIIG